MRKNRVFRKASGLLLVILISISQTASAAAAMIDLSHGKEMMVTLVKIVANKDIRPPLPSLRLLRLIDFQPLTASNENEVDAAFGFDGITLEFKNDPHLTDDSPPNPAANDSEPKLFGILYRALFRFHEPGEPIPTPAVLILVGLIALIALKRRRR